MLFYTYISISHKDTFFVLQDTYVSYLFFVLSYCTKINVDKTVVD